MLIFITISCMLLIIYHHVGYPLLLKWLTQLPFFKRKLALSENDSVLATIAVLIPAFNEQQYIAEKIRNLAFLDYPSDRLKIYIVCDGCTDNTANIARQTASETGCDHLDIDIIEFTVNQGKVAVINKVLPVINQEVIAMSDVSALISIDALKLANRAFSDKNVGLVTGHYILANPGSSGESTYWQYQSDLKQRETQLNSVIGAHGALYLIRRELFLPLAPNTINDDFVIAMSVVEQGYRAIYVATINAIELEQASNQLDLHRRRRIAAGNLQQMIRFKSLLLPKYKGVAFTFASGKALRVFMPLILIIAWLGSLALTTTAPFFMVAASVQSLIYLSVIIFGLVQPQHPNKIWQTLYYLVSGYTVNLIGCVYYIRYGKCSH